MTPSLVPCPWLIARFIDKEPEFLYAPSAEVMQTAEAAGAAPNDIPGVEMSHVAAKPAGVHQRGNSRLTAMDGAVDSDLLCGAAPCA